MNDGYELERQLGDDPEFVAAYDDYVRATVPVPRTPDDADIDPDPDLGVTPEPPPVLLLRIVAALLVLVIVVGLYAVIEFGPMLGRLVTAH